MKPTRPYHFHGNYYKEPSGLKRLDFIVQNIKKQYAETGSRLTVLEVGCGNGNIAISVGSLGIADILGVDIDNESIRMAIQQNSFQNVRFMHCDIERMQLAGKYDVIICSEVLEHLERPAKILESCKELLASNGVMLITIPNGYGPFELKLRLSHWLKMKFVNSDFGDLLNKMMKSIRGEGRIENIQSLNVKNQGGGHLHFFTLRKFKALLFNNGLTASSVSNSNCWFGFGVAWYLLLYRFIKRGSLLFHTLDSFDCIVADYVPHCLSAGWYFKIKRYL